MTLNLCSEISVKHLRQQITYLFSLSNKYCENSRIFLVKLEMAFKKAFIQNVTYIFFVVLNACI